MLVSDKVKLTFLDRLMACYGWVVNWLPAKGSRGWPSSMQQHALAVQAKIRYMFEAHASVRTFASAAVAISVKMHLLWRMTLT